MYSFCTVALPLLESTGVPGTVLKKECLAKLGIWNAECSMAATQVLVLSCCPRMPVSEDNCQHAKIPNHFSQSVVCARD